MATVQDQLILLKALLAEVADLRHAADLVEWDERVYMPAGGVHTHGEMSATLRRLAHPPALLPVFVHLALGLMLGLYIPPYLDAWYREAARMIGG